MTELKAVTVRTANFGDIDFPDDRILWFREGIPGFSEIRRFAVLELENIAPFQYLQALDNPTIALLIVNPFLLHPGYTISLEETYLVDLQAAGPEDVSVYVVATVPDNPAGATINLMAPILINEKKRLGMQVILLDSAYSICHPLLDPGGKAPDG